MLSQQIPIYIKTCRECQRLELLAKNATVELTLLEAARRLTSDPGEYERLGVLMTEAYERQRESRRALWNHAIWHPEYWDSIGGQLTLSFEMPAPRPIS